MVFKIRITSRNFVIPLIKAVVQLKEVQLTLLPAMESQMGSRGIALLFL
jgi:hypothetical protein